LETRLLQDWVTVQGNAQVLTVTQSVDSWLDIPDHEDLIFYLEVKQIANAPQMFYLTAPTREARSLWMVIAPFAMTLGVRADPALFAYTLVPPARYVTSLVGTTNANLTWNATFRIWLAAYSLG